MRRGFGALHFVVVGGLLVSIGLLPEALAVPALWSAVAFAVAGFAYVTHSVAPFGKSDDGELDPFRAFVLAPYLTLAMLAWRAQSLVEAPYAEVAPGIFVGRRPRSAAEVPAQAERVLDLTCEFRRSPFCRALAYRAVPTLDGAAPDEGALLGAIEALRAEPGPVLIHCAIGHGRSATAAAVLLVARGHAPDVGAAVDRMRAARPRVRLHRGQRRVAERVAAVLAPGDG